MANPWSIAWTGWTVVVIGWLLVPIISLIVNKLFAYLIFDSSKELRDLELDTIPALQATLRDVEEQRIVGAASDEGSRSDLERLDKMDMHLKSALYEAEDILDLVDYLRKEKELTGGDSIISLEKYLLDAAGACIVAGFTGSWALLQRFFFAAGACVACWWGSLIRRCRNITPAPLLQRVQSLKQQLLRLLGSTIGRWSSGALLPISGATSSVGVQRFYRWIFRQRQYFSDWCRQLLPYITSCCRSVLSWFRCQRDWSYQRVGMQVDQIDGNAVESLLPITERIRLRKQIKGIEGVIILSKKSHLLNQSSITSTTKDADKESSSKQKEILDLHRSIEQKVFGRDVVRADISRMLREGPDADAATSSTRKPYSVIGIYGITGSGKSILAQYVCDHEKDAGHFKPIMFIRVGKTFSVGDILRDMLVLITQSRPSNDRGLQSLKTELEEKLRGKRFLLVLDDLWVNDDNQMEREILLDTLNAALSGSKILVTAQKTDASEALGAQKQISIPDLEEKVYLSLFMHHALQDASDDDGQYGRIGRKIANRLRRSPIAAVTVGKQLQRNKSISFWKTTANLDVLNKTMGALWWSYQQLGVDIRRCFAYCSTFPKGYELDRDELVRIWVAQGFVNNRLTETEDAEDVGHRYFDELLTFSFLQADKKVSWMAEAFTIHDLLHDLAERVSGREFFRVVLNGSTRDIPRGVRHLFIETDNGAEIILEKILDLENLRTLIVKELEPINYDIGKTLERLFIRLTKLRVLIIKLDYGTKEWSIPESIDHTKHLRYLCAHFQSPLSNLIFPSTFSKLYHMQTIDVPSLFASYPRDMDNLICLRHVSICELSFPNVGRLTSLQTLGRFTVVRAHGHELKQLKHLNKLQGTLAISGLENVGSKEEAREAHLVDKEQLRTLELLFCLDMDPDVAAEVLEGLLPPKDLEQLNVWYYKGSRYPSWILSPRHPDALKFLHRLELTCCSQLPSIPEGSELFIGLRELFIMECDWDRLPENMEVLVSLQRLVISKCDKVKLLPKLPHQSLETIRIIYCEILSATCKIVGHKNWDKIKHIPDQSVEEITDLFLDISSECLGRDTYS